MDEREEPQKKDFQIERPLNDEESAAFDIVSKLQRAGYETYIAGGAVRDMLLGHPSHDVDIATAAKPEEIKKILPESYDRGKAFGVKALRVGNHEFEIATFRSDIGIEDHRHPQKVEFTSAANDALRRDFTINALFYDSEKKQVIDYTDGLRDLKNKIVRFVGMPEMRIKEDYLRMLRAVRFTHRLDFALEPESAKAIKANASQICDISAERIREELTNIIVGPHRERALMQMESLEILKAILPELSATRNVKQPPEFHSEGDVWIHTLLAMESLEKPTPELAWTVLLHDVAKPQTQAFRDHPKSKITFFEHDVQGVEVAKKILTRLKFSNDFIDACLWAISQHMRIVHAFREMSERKQRRLFTHPHIDLLLDLTKADLGSSLRPDLKAELGMYHDAVQKREEFQRANEDEKKQAKKFDLITGKDIMEQLNISSGPEVGRIKNQIEELYLEGKISTREEALKKIKELK